MAITLVNPDGLPKLDVYRQVSIATGSKLVFIAGQVACDADGGTVGEGDLAAQVEQCYLNIGTALAEVGGSFDDVAKLTVYVVDWTPDKMPLLVEGVARAAAKLGVDPVPPITAAGRRGAGRTRPPGRGRGHRGPRLSAGRCGDPNPVGRPRDSSTTEIPRGRAGDAPGPAARTARPGSAAAPPAAAAPAPAGRPR